MDLDVTHITTVRDVIETNDCSGKKSIEIISLESDESHISRFILSPIYRQPYDKLLLSTVFPTDRVIISPTYFPEHPHIAGEFTDIVADTHTRVPLCRCGQRTVSDGFHIFCPNEECGLSVMSRLERLANTRFFAPAPFESESTYHIALNTPTYPPMDMTSLAFGYDTSITNPFLPILQNKLWGDERVSIETLLLTRRHGSVSLATFLVEDLFISFIDSACPSSPYINHIFSGIREFYGYMDELTQRRDVDNPQQNHFIKEFLWSLGIESLCWDIIDKMVHYEMASGITDDPLRTYGYLLTNPDYTSKEIGIHPLEARSISIEFMRRRYEMYDIFRRYTNYEGFIDIFNTRLR